MKEDIKREWVENLLSGKYTQGAGVLRDRSDRFCCLGVLCDMAVRAGVIEPPVFIDCDEGFRYDGQSGLPSEVVVNWAGLPSENGVKWHDDEGVYFDLVTINDNGSSFAKIAEVIEERL